MGSLRAYLPPALERSNLWLDVIAKAPEQLQWLANRLKNAAPQLELADAALSLPKDMADSASRALPHFQQLWQSLAGSSKTLADRLDSIRSPDDAVAQQGPITQAFEQVEAAYEQANRFWFVFLCHSMHQDIAEARKLLDLVTSLNTHLASTEEGFASARKTFAHEAAEATKATQQAAAESSDSIRQAAQQVVSEVDKHLAETKEKFAAALQEAAEYTEKTKQQYKEAKEHFQNQAMSAFGKAFDQEATTAEEKAAGAGKYALIAIILLVLVIATFVVLEICGVVQYSDSTQLWRWSLTRVSALAFLGWFIGHYFRERRNFLHVAVANRHRRNLCNAYIALAEKMPDDAREQYLAHILPELAVLGKTGFITREELSEGPSGALAQACLDFMKGKAPKPPSE